MTPLSLTAAILTHNEEAMIVQCLRTLSWCDEIIVLDHNSTDKTVSLAKASGATVLHSQNESFAVRREELLAACKTNWIVYIDADERITPKLADEIKEVIAGDTVDAARFHRKNYFFGRNFSNGGWATEMVTRLFRVTKLSGWNGSIHESPVFEGAVKELRESLRHFSHRCVTDGLIKTTQWTPMEAELLARNLQSPVTFWTVLRKGLGEVWRRGILQSGWKDGAAGGMEILTQAINRMLVYMQVWELQQKPSVAGRYQDLETKITTLWQKNH